MDTPTFPAWSLGLLAMTALSLVALVVVVRGLRRSRRELAAQADQADRARAAQLALEQRLEDLTQRLKRLEPTAAQESAHDTAYVITDAGDPDYSGPGVPVPDRLVLSATVGEPLVKAVALGHGLRRALSPEARNRIRFEMRRETRRSRRQRRREMRDAWLASKRADAVEPRGGPPEAAKAA